MPSYKIRSKIIDYNTDKHYDNNAKTSVMNHVKQFFFFMILFSSSAHWAQEIKHGASTQLVFSRMGTFHNFAYEMDFKKVRYAAYLGYAPLHLIQNHSFTLRVGLSFHRMMLEQEKLAFFTTLDLSNTFVNTVLNHNFMLSNALAGYTLTYGNKIQFVQHIGLGLSVMSAPKTEVRPRSFIDFQFALGARYRFNYD